MERLVKLIEKHLDRLDLKFSKGEADSIFIIEIAGENHDFFLVVHVVAENLIFFYAELPLDIPEDKLCFVLDFLNAVNEGAILSSTLINTENRKVGAKSFYFTDNASINLEVLRSYMTATVRSVDLITPDIIKIATQEYKSDDWEDDENDEDDEPNPKKEKSYIDLPFTLNTTKKHYN